MVLRERPISELYGKERGTSMGVDESISVEEDERDAKLTENRMKV